MLSLLARRATLGTMVPLAARIVHPPVLSLIARRTLFSTPQLNISPTDASDKKEKKTRKTAEKKAGESKAVAKRGRPPKSQAKPTRPQERKQRVRIPNQLKPPKRAPGPYLLFYASWVKSQPQPSTLSECQELSKRAGEIWKGYSMAEKQPFYDEGEIRKAQAKQEREEFFRKTPISDLRQLNAIRKAQGKTKLHSTKKSAIPATAFIQFSNEFRNSTDGQAIINEMSPERSHIVRAVVAAADRWRSMSAEEKAPYFERYRKAKEEMKAEHAET